jgi:ABC-type phosphate transport system substrate-binding protein
MNRSIRNRIAAVAATAAALALGQGEAAQAVLSTDALRTGGCSGCFNAQVNAALNNFSLVTRVIRGCASGRAASPNLDACDGGLSNGTGGDLMDYVILEGNLKNSGGNPNNFGVNGGATGVRYRISANGSSNGIRCANSANPNRIGFLSDEGFNGDASAADDAGAGANEGGAGAGADGQVGFGGASSGADDTIAALVTCNTQFGAGEEFPPPPGTSYAGMVEQCIVQWDIDQDGQIDNANVGVVPGSQTTVRPSGANESFNLSLYCDTGYADLPTTDFIAPTLNTQTFQDAIVHGAQIFKFVASNDVHQVGQVNEKVQLNDPQVEALFSAPGSAGLCNWSSLGGDAGSTNDNVNVCIRDPGSGTKETFRNTWLLNARGFTAEATGTSTGTSGGCLQSLEGGGSLNSTKTVFSFNTNGDVLNCVETKTGAIGYVDAADDSPDSYGVPVEGVDPDTNDLALLVKCGHYRWWGPLAGGRVNSDPVAEGGTTSDRAGPATIHETGHRNALSNPGVATTFFVPFGNAALGGVALRKTVTDGAYSVGFAPTGCPAQPNPVGTIN